MLVCNNASEHVSFRQQTLCTTIGFCVFISFCLAVVDAKKRKLISTFFIFILSYNSHLYRPCRWIACHHAKFSNKILFRLSLGQAHTKYALPIFYLAGYCLLFTPYIFYSHNLINFSSALSLPAEQQWKRRNWFFFNFHVIASY